ncbi:MAG TPA: autotransporter-associated beta strand repeat-containing protein, partial [Chthoniobacterales bacterium]|nr:autotransporter-associated beta strand repeat-containing protein [Chthoniobacterales bacterium]
MRFLSWIWVQGVGVDRKIKRAGFLAVVCLGVLPAHGQDATWDSAPGSGDWNTATNWSPATVPTGTATFGSSNTTAITFSAASTTVGEMLFNAGAPAYTFTFIELGTQTLTITGAGIVNNSSHRPTFSPGVLIPSTSFVDTLQFQNSSTAGNAIITDYPGGQTDFFNTSTAGNATITSRANFAANGIIDFFDASTAGNATITNSSLKSAGNKTGLTEFHDTSTAANATITNNTNGFTDFFDTSTAGHASITNNQVGITIFQDTSTAANATITTTFAGALTEFLDASTAGNAIITNSGGNTLFQGTSTAGNATIITNSQDGRASRTDFLGTSTAGNANLTINSGGVTSFQGTSTAGNSTITTNSGGVTAFEDTSTGGNARLVTNAGGIVDISSLSSGGITVGSIAGAGNYRLGAKTLTVGLNNLSTEVSGTIADGGIAGGTGGALTKVGTGTLTLSGANTYTGNTEVDAGGLLVTGSLGATQVTVASGASLGGSGKIAGPVTVLNGGILAPGDPATLRVGPLTLNSGSILNYQLGVPNIVGSGTNDLVIVNGKLTLAGTLNITNAGGFGGGVYRLFNYTGSLTNNGLAFGTLPAGFTATDLLLQTSQAGQINLVVSATGSTDQFWDGTTTTGDGTIHGGSGTWNNVTTNWTNLDGKINAPWNNGFAIFSGTAGTVTLGA